MTVKKLALAAVALALIFPPAARALGKDYVFRSRANWVKLEKLSAKQMAGTTLRHPYENLDPTRMEAMLLSLSLDKGSLFRNEIKTRDIFSIEEARRFAPHIVEALGRAGPNQVVNVAVVHERPYFIMQRDYISIINVFVTDEGVHFYFSKLFAKLESDYEQASKMDRAIAKAHGLRVSLETGPGQKLVYSEAGDEVVLDPSFDFAGSIHRTVAAEKEYRPGAEDKKAERQTKKARKKAEREDASEDVATAGEGDTAERLKRLDDLKRQKLITPQEYRTKREEILKGL